LEAEGAADTDLSVAVMHLADSPAVALVRDSPVDFLVGEITTDLGAVLNAIFYLLRTGYR
jgi:hypothetical protein